MKNLIINFYVLQIILQRGDLPQNEKNQFEKVFNDISSKLKRNNFSIKPIEKKEEKIIDDPLSGINTDALIVGFRLLLEKDGETIKPNNELLNLPYEFLLQRLSTN